MYTELKLYKKKNIFFLDDKFSIIIRQQYQNNFIVRIQRTRI